MSVLSGCGARPGAPRVAPTTSRPTRDVVACPGFLSDDGSDFPAGSERQLEPEVVVLGQVRHVERGQYEVGMDRVLFGYAEPGARLRFVSRAGKVEVGSRVVALAPSGRSDVRYQALYSLGAGEAEVARALGQARLDCLAAGSSAAFISTGEHRVANQIHRVDVKRVLYGDVADHRLAVSLRPAVLYSYTEPARRGEAMIYLLREPTELDDPAAMAGAGGYVAVARFPVAMMAPLRDALERRARNPLVSREVEGAPLDVREVLFAGSTEQAVASLGSASAGAVELMSATLARRGAAALPALLRIIDRQLFAPAPPEQGGFGQLRAAIAALGRLQGVDRAAVLEPRLRRLLEHAEAGGDAPLVPAGASPRWKEASLTDVNHSLTWLCLALGRGTLANGLGRELLNARDRVAETWRRELALAIETSGVEDEIDLTSALARAIATGAGTPAVPRMGNDDLELVVTDDDRVLVRVRGDAAPAALEQHCSFGGQATSTSASPKPSEELPRGIEAPEIPAEFRLAPPGVVDRRRREIWYLAGGIGGGRLEVGRLALDTGVFTDVGAVYVADFTGNCRGLVPDGRQLYLANPGYFAFDRDTLAPTVRAPWLGWVDSLAFSPDGKRMVVVSDDPYWRPAERRVLADGVELVIEGGAIGSLPVSERRLLRVVDAATGRTLMARWMPAR